MLWIQLPFTRRCQVTTPRRARLWLKENRGDARLYYGFSYSKLGDP